MCSSSPEGSLPSYGLATFLELYPRAEARRPLTQNLSAGTEPVAKSGRRKSPTARPLAAEESRASAMTLEMSLAEAA